MHKIADTFQRSRAGCTLSCMPAFLPVTPAAAPGEGPQRREVPHSTVVRGKKADAQVAPKPWRARRSPHLGIPPRAGNGPRHSTPTGLPTSGVETPPPLEAGSDFRLLGAGPGVPPAGGHVQAGEQKGAGLSPAGRRVYPGGEEPGAAVGHQHSPVMHAPLLPAEPASVQLRPLGYCPQPTAGEGGWVLCFPAVTP